MIIYIRHGNDEQSHPRYKDDPRIRRDCFQTIWLFAREMIQKYGYPDLIYISPLVRTVDTVQIMQLSPTPDLQIHPGLSRFFLKEETQISPETFIRRVPLNETWRQFKWRVKSTVKWIDQNSKGKVVWCITHASVISRVAKYYRVQIPTYLEFLETLVIRD